MKTRDSRFVVLLLWVLLALAPSQYGFANSFANPDSVQAQVNWKQLFNQLFAWNIAKNAEIPFGKQKHREAMRQSIYYSGNTVHSDFRAIIESGTSTAAFDTRERLLSNSQMRSQLLESDLSAKNYDFKTSPAKKLVELIEQEQKEVVDINYFRTPLGRKIFSVMSDTVMIIIPGFGSHTITDYSIAEFVEEANVYYGRPKVNEESDFDYSHHAMRPRRKVGDETVWEDHVTFYSHHTRKLGFDVLHPMGYELGNSMGTNDESAKFLRDWILALPAEYANKKLVLLGYSKGTPIAQSMVELYPDMRKRTTTIVTFAGAVQGSIAAQSGLRQLQEETGAKSVDEAISIAEKKPETMLSLIAPILKSVPKDVLENAKLLEALAKLGFDAAGAKQGLTGMMEAKQVRKALLGVRDLSLNSRAEWNLTKLNDAIFDSPLTIFNMSSITNVKDFFMPYTPGEFGPATSPLPIPTLDKNGMVDFRNFSLDAVFLYLTSISGFEEAPGGLFDTQVGWLDTKSFPLDQRPLGHSLTEKELDALWTVDAVRSALEKNGFNRQDLAEKPRNSLIQKLSNVDFVDLVESRSTHWNITFRQVYKPPFGIKPHYNHHFPRMAYATALLETLAVYRLTQSKEI